MESNNKCKNNHALKEYEKFLCVPTESGVRNFNNIVSYFLYRAPYIDSVHHRSELAENDAREAFEKIIKKSNMGKSYKILKRVKENAYKSLELEGDKICLECNRMIFNIHSGETELKALLRHIRNSLAHGLVYIYRKNKRTYVFFQDLESKKEKKITARIVVDVNLLNDWKAIIENYYVIGE